MRIAAGAVGASIGADAFELIEEDNADCLEDVLGRRRMDPERPALFGAGAVDATAWRPLDDPAVGPD